MKRILILLLLCCFLPLAGLAEEKDGFVLTATVAAEESALLSLPVEESAQLLSLAKGDVLTITALGTTYCEALAGDAAGYVATADIAFDVMEGEPTRLGIVDVSPTNLLHGHMSLRESASTKSAALCRMAKGCLVLIIGEENGMYHLAMPGYIGYGQKKNIDDDVKPVGYRIAYVKNDDAVHLRLDSRYGENWIVMKLEPGTPVQFIRNPNGWAQVEVAGHRGRIVAKYLSFDAPEAE